MESKNSLKVFSDGGARGNPGPAASAFLVKDCDNKIIFLNTKKKKKIKKKKK